MHVAWCAEGFNILTSPGRFLSVYNCLSLAPLCPVNMLLNDKGNALQELWSVRFVFPSILLHQSGNLKECSIYHL